MRTVDAATDAATDAAADASANQQIVTSATYHLFMRLVGINALIVATFYFIPLILPILPHGVREVLYFADTIHALLFLFDFGLRLKRAPHRARYFMRWGWMDLLTGIPGLPALRLLRLGRVAHTTRLEKSQTPAVREAARRQLAQGTLLVVAGLVLLVVVYGSVAIVMVEAKAPGANITSGGDAIWWAFVTIATVGYGDTYPVTGAGRLIGVLMLVAGVSLFSVLTSFLSSTFLRPAAQREESRDSALRAELVALREAHARLEAALAALPYTIQPPPADTPTAGDVPPLDDVQ